MAQVSHRDHLIRGAIKCLQTKGYARTTARDIATASGANLASIGYHFGSKEALLDQALIRILEERNRHVGTVAFSAEDASPLERMTTTFAAVREIFEKHRPLLVAFVEAMAQVERSGDLRAQMANHYREARRGMGMLLRAGLGDAAERLRSDPEVMASFMMAALDGLVLQWLMEPADTPNGEELVGSLAEWMALALEQSTLADGPGRRGASIRVRSRGRSERASTRSRNPQASPR